MIRALAQSLGQDNTVVYLSFLVRHERPLNAGVFNGFFGVTLDGPGGDLFIGKAGGGALEEYVLETRGGGGQVTSGAPVQPRRTALIVVRREFLAGNDVFTMHVNPRPWLPEPTTGVMKNDLDVGVVPAVGIYSSGAFTVDEIRIGDAYADVLPRR